MDGQNGQGGNGNHIFGEGSSSQGLEINFDDRISLDGLGFNQIFNHSESSTSLDSNKHQKSGGRPKKIRTMEELYECKGYTLEAAAKKLGASTSTVKRRVTELTNKTWVEFQQSIPDSQRQREKETSIPDSQRPPEKETMQGEDKAVIAVYYNGGSHLFDLTKIKKPRRFQELEKLLKKSFNLLPKTYHFKYFRGEEYTVFNNDTLNGCLSLADQSNLIKLKVEVIDADKRI